MKDKIIITGTGRAGTTVLVQLLSLCGLNTGFHKLSAIDIERYINEHSRGGLEIKIDSVTDVTNTSHEAPFIVKAPALMLNMEEIIEEYNILKVYVPIRDLEETAKSREKHGKRPGGLWHAETIEEQMIHNAKGIYNLVHFCAIKEIEIKFIDFELMLNNKEYLWSLVQDFASESDSSVDVKVFEDAYNQSIDLSKVTTKK